ncbi:protein-tyrosine phosphatase-like protein, partial [Mycena galopus ATCC 62051]
SFSHITPHIAIADLAFAERADLLEREGVTHVVSVLREKSHIPSCIPLSNRLHVPLDDAPFAELVGLLAPVVSWEAEITPARTPIRILIHCAHGISRSPAVGAALLVALPLRTLSAPAALAYVSARRPAADVNWGFRAQLREWEGVCRGGKHAATL